MKSLLISIKPKHVAEILNHRKTIEIRKTAPKCDLPIEVYIYCTKGDEKLVYHRYKGHGEYLAKNKTLGYEYNGYVVAKFILKKAEEFIQGLNEAEYEHLPNFALKDYGYYGLEDLMEKACLNDEEITKYAPDLSFYAWHIDGLVTFDEPKELNEFGLKRAPESWRYVED